MKRFPSLNIFADSASFQAFGGCPELRVARARKNHSTR